MNSSLVEMRLLDSLLCVVLVFAAIPSEQASGVVVTSQGQGSSNGTPHAGCPRSCGNLTFDYPFGIGSNCFRSPEFNLTCDNTTQPPRLYLRDGTAEVVDNIDARTDNFFLISLSHAMPMIHGVSTYNMPWKAAGFILDYTRLNITGCDFNIYRIDQGTNASVRLSTVTYPADAEITDEVARQNCGGTGCYSIWLDAVEAFQLEFVLRNHSRDALGTHTNRSSLWNNINVTSDYAEIRWSIVDQPSCASAMDDRANYACVSNHSVCSDGYGMQDFGYTFICEEFMAMGCRILDIPSLGCHAKGFFEVSEFH